MGSSPQKYPQQSMGEASIVVGGLLDTLKIDKNLTKSLKHCENYPKIRTFFTSSEVEIN